MNRSVIAVYKPRPDQLATLLKLVAQHWPLLSREGLVTARRPLVMQAKDGTVIEVFEWASPEAIDQAHSNPAVMALWDQFATACEYVPIATVPEAGQMFSEFTTLEFE